MILGMFQTLFFNFLMEYKVSLNPYDIDQRLMMFHKETLGFTTCDKITTILKENHDVLL